MNAMTFHRWLLAKRLRYRGPVGDLARDVVVDENAPFIPNTLASWRVYLAGQSSDAALEALATAWSAYQRAMGKTPAPLTPLHVEPFETPEAFAAAANRERRKK